MKVYVFVGLFQGIVEEVKVTTSLEEAKKYFYEFTGIQYDSYSTNKDLLLESDEEGSEIYECNLSLQVLNGYYI